MRTDVGQCVAAKKPAIPVGFDSQNRAVPPPLPRPQMRERHEFRIFQLRLYKWLRIARDIQPIQHNSLATEYHSAFERFGGEVHVVDTLASDPRVVLVPVNNQPKGAIDQERRKVNGKTWEG